MGVAGGTEDFVLVIPKNLEPGTEVGSVGVRVVGDAALGHQEDAGELRPQLFLRIVEVSKAVTLIQGLPVEPLASARPVGELMEGGPEISTGRLEGRRRRKLNGVGQTVVEGALGLVMTGSGAAGSQ